MPHTADVERAVNDFVTAGNDLHTTRSTIRGTEKDLDDRRASISEQSQDHAEQTEALTTRKDNHEALVERLRTEEALLDAPLRGLQRQLEEAQTALDKANAACGQADAEAQAQQTRLTTAENALEHISEALTTALDEQLRTIAGLEPYARPDLLALTVKFDLDLFMTGHDLWIAYPTVPRIARGVQQPRQRCEQFPFETLQRQGAQLDDLPRAGELFPRVRDLSRVPVGCTGPAVGGTWRDRPPEREG